jgi:sigma-B regulation protein RsbU (phosphoserine phosphatase)
MRFRWKLLLLMLAISILPIVILRTFGIHTVRSMAAALSEEIQIGRLEAARNEIQSLLNGCREALNMERERVAMALSFLSDLLRRGSTPQTDEEPVPQRAFNATFPSIAADGASSRLCVIAPEPERAATLRQAAWLMQTTETFAAVAEHFGEMVLHQDLAYTSGVAASYPCPRAGLRPGDVTQAGWYRAAFVESVFSWSRPVREVPTGRWVVSISALPEDDAGQPMGVASVTVALDKLLETILAFSNLPGRTRAFLCMIDQNPADGVIGLRVLLESNAPPTSEPQWLPVPETGLAPNVIEDVARRSSRIVRAPFEGQDAFWAYAPLPCQGSAVMLIIPADEPLQATQALQSKIREHVENVEMLTAAFLIGLAVMNAVLVFVFSRTVTRPLTALSKAAERLAAGEFDARVDIDSKDEFASMGVIFNRVGPQLKEHFRVREALQAAVEIQQSLLPKAPPSIPGLDMFAMSLFSDKIGGDYYDYLCVREGGNQRLCVAVGDVSGHGISSAITMATVRAFLRLRASQPGTLAEVIADVNRKLVEDVEYSGQFMTFFLARIDRGARRMEWIRAGHDPGVLYDIRRDVFSELAGEGAPLGLSEHTRFVASAMEIAPGQVIVIGTDGIWETRNPSGEMFGKTRLTELIRQHAETSAQGIVLAVLDSVEEFRGPGEPEDDITLMAVKVNG